MTLEGWIFMVGLRVFDIGALIVGLVWFFRLREDDDGDDFRRDDGGAPEPEPEPSGPGGLQLPLPDAEPWPARRRDHAGDHTPRPGSPRRVPEPVPARAPVKRRAGSPHTSAAVSCPSNPARAASFAAPARAARSSASSIAIPAPRAHVSAPAKESPAP